MKKAIVFLALIIVSGCADIRQQPDISGAWSGINYPSNQYFFNDGILEIHSIAVGEIVWQKYFAFEQDREIGALEIRNPDGVYFQGSVTFSSNGDTATLIQQSGLNIRLLRW